jgi:hypothetical protein
MNKSIIICTDPDLSIIKQKKEEKKIFSSSDPIFFY